MTTIHRRLTILAALFLVFNTGTACATEYAGTLGSQEISVSLTKDTGQATYFYNKFRTPITLNQKQDTGTELVYVETQLGKPIAEFHLNDRDDTLQGYWRNLRTGQRFDVSLSRRYDERGLIQSASFPNEYVRIQCDDSDKTVNIIDKATDNVRQTIQTGGQCLGDELQVFDYNFDGNADFSVFESFYAGPNTSRLYYLYDPKTRTYAQTEELSLTSLEFDARSKTITSTNQCCAGSRILVETYRWAGAKLKRVNGICYVLDKAGNHVAKPGKACE